jgi:glucose-1-phosphatase
VIKAIIFDLGGVILKHSETITEDIISRLFNSSPSALEIFQQHKIKIAKGETTIQELLTLLKINQNSHESLEDLLNKWMEHYKELASEIDWELIAFIDKLKKKYAVYLFSDTNSLHNEYNKTRGIYEHFQMVFKSFEEHVSKKESKAAFSKFLSKIEEKPGECIFIDDKIGNVENAEKAGIRAIHYKNNQQLEEELKSLGIKTG